MSIEQILEINNQITVILGDNGSGKTSILEILKYAITGCFPPGSGNGKWFVHDPSLTEKKMGMYMHHDTQRSGSIFLYFNGDDSRAYVER